MRLDLGTFPVEEVHFGSRTHWKDGSLEINSEELVKQIMSDPRIAHAKIELAKPGESTRIWPVRDVIEPRIKVKGPGTVYPGVCDRAIITVGQGVTHRLAGVAVIEVSEVLQHEAGGDFTEVYIDMSGPWAKIIPYASLLNVCVVVEPDPVLHVDIKNRAVHQACLTVSDALASTVKDLVPPQSEVFELKPVSSSLPNVVYIPCIHSPQAMSGSLSTFCVSIYGITQLTPPWVLHPNELLDGAISGPYRTPFATSWALVNNPVLLEMYRRHGTDFNFVTCIALRTEWTKQYEKELVALQTAKYASLFGAQGAMVTWDAGGNEFMEVIRTVQACERLGIKTIFLTSEDYSAEGVSTMLEPIPEADAMTSTGFFPSAALGLGELPPVERVIGSPQKVVGPLRDQIVPTAGKLTPPRRYDDHYGFNRLTCVET